MSETVIKVENLSKIYKLYDKPIDRMKEALNVRRKKYHRDHYALKNISFEVKKGDNIGIVGTNGSGKSTLLKIITGVLSPSSGKLEVNGKISALLELGTGFNPEYTGIENIYLSGTMMGFKKTEIENKIADILKFADIGEFINQPVKTYSSGMFARLAFAVAINVEPEILIVDEALSVGDTRFQIKCMDKMKEMMEGGTTVLFVSHDTNAIRRFCNKGIWINNGIVKNIGRVNDIMDEYLDYLKLGEDREINIDRQLISEEKPFIPGNNIAEIIDFKILDKNHNEIESMGIHDYVKIEMLYDVYDENVHSPVIGVAIRGMDDDYVCGLNTLIDNVEIPWKYGRNKICLEYTSGIMAIGGKYYFDAAIFDKTATIPIDYKSIIKDILIKSDYLGEGRYIMPHTWKGNVYE